jgi:hypothetical protein
LIFTEIRNRVAFCLLLLHFAARTKERPRDAGADGRGDT